MPSSLDSTVAPPGQAPDVDVHAVRAVRRSKTARGPTRCEDEYADRCFDIVEQYAPGFKESVIDRQILTPVDIETTFGLTGGNIFQGAMPLHQLFMFRPVPGYAGYDTPIKNLYPLRRGRASGRRRDGSGGLERRARHAGGALAAVKRAALAAILCAALPIAAPAASPVASADAAYAAGDFATALSGYQDAVRRSPNDPAAHVGRARLALYGNDLDTAEREAARALQLDPSSDAATRLQTQIAQRREASVPAGLPPGVDQVTIPFIQLDPLPLVLVHVNGVKAFFIVDTGAPNVVLDPGFARLLHVKSTPSGTGTFAGGKRPRSAPERFSTSTSARSRP